jgi:hypothetical protein
MRNRLGVAILLNSFASFFALSRLRGACFDRRVIAQGYLELDG